MSFGLFICRSYFITFYRAAWNASADYSYEKGVCLSNAWFVTTRKKLYQHSYTTWKTIRPSFVTRRVVGGVTLLPENLGPTDPVGEKTAIFNRYSLVYSASAVTHSAKSAITLIGSPLHAFQSPVNHKMNIVHCPEAPKGGSKMQTGRFRVKSHFALRKSATKFLCVKTVSDEVVRHSFAYPSMQKWLVGNVPF